MEWKQRKSKHGLWSGQTLRENLLEQLWIVTLTDIWMAPATERDVSDQSCVVEIAKENNTLHSPNEVCLTRCLSAIVLREVDG